MQSSSPPNPIGLHPPLGAHSKTWQPITCFTYTGECTLLSHTGPDTLPLLSASLCRRKLDRISEDDVKTAISKIHKLGAGFQLLESGSNTLVVSVPTELSSDHSSILQLAQGKCYVTLPALKDSLQWKEGRIRMALDLMMQGGMVWVDSGAKDGVMRYWFPSLWQQSRLEETVRGEGGTGGLEGAGGGSG